MSRHSTDRYPVACGLKEWVGIRTNGLSRSFPLRYVMISSQTSNAQADLFQEDLESSSTLSGLPISLSRIDVHAEWVSPAVLKLMGDLPDHVEGGQIVRDEAGKPTGVFVSHTIAVVAPTLIPCDSSIMRWI